MSCLTHHIYVTLQRRSSLPPSLSPTSYRHKLGHRRPYYLRSMSSYPANIKAIQVTAHGGPEVLAVGPSVIVSSGAY